MCDISVARLPVQTTRLRPVFSLRNLSVSLLCTCPHVDASAKCTVRPQSAVLWWQVCSERRLLPVGRSGTPAEDWRLDHDHWHRQCGEVFCRTESTSCGHCRHHLHSQLIDFLLIMPKIRVVSIKQNICWHKIKQNVYFIANVFLCAIKIEYAWCNSLARACKIVATF